jgi:hypothetical protein
MPLLLLFWVPGEENLDDILESQELRRVVPGEGEPDLGMVNIFSEDSLLANAGLCAICAGGVTGASFDFGTPLLRTGSVLICGLFAPF